VIASESTPAPPTVFACGEVRGGNGAVHAQVTLPGLRGVLYSRPCAGATGGDIHYLSVCGSGLMARVCLADVAGHGSAVAAIGTEMHAHLRRSVDVIDERKVLGRLNRRLNERGVGVMTTAVLATYYPPRRRGCSRCGRSLRRRFVIVCGLCHLAATASGVVRGDRPHRVPRRRAPRRGHPLGAADAGPAPPFNQLGARLGGLLCRGPTCGAGTRRASLHDTVRLHDHDRRRSEPGGL
jgi:Stage II sporulation protein E (SpoIIE)